MPKKRAKGKKPQSQPRKPVPVLSAAPVERGMDAPLYPYRRSLARALICVPLFLGAFAPKGFILGNPEQFALVFVGVIAGDEAGKRLKFSGSTVGCVAKIVGCLLAFLVLLSIFALFAKALVPTLLYAFSMLGSFLLAQDRGDSVRRILGQIVLSIVLSSCLGVLGVFTQLSTVVWGTLLFGMPASMLYASSLVVRYAGFFESAGWKRGYPVINRKGKQVFRPLALARLVSILLFLGPALPAAFAFAKLAPFSYSMIGLLLFAAPKPAAAFLSGTENDTAVAERIEQLALASPVVLLVLGLI